MTTKSISNKISDSWLARIASTQTIILQPITLASDYHIHPSPGSLIAIIAMVVASGIFINFTFIKDIKAIIKSKEPVAYLMKEYAWVFAVGCMNIMIFAIFYYLFGISHGNQIEVGSWYNSFYFSIVTWTTLGYGDFSPVENLRLLAALEAMLGYVYMAILVGLLLNITQHKSQ